MDEVIVGEFMMAPSRFFLHVTDGVVDQQNLAVAYASCTDCQTVALAFQVVLVVGQPRAGHKWSVRVRWVRIIGTNRGWLKNYGVLHGLVKNRPSSCHGVSGVNFPSCGRDERASKSEVVLKARLCR